MVTELPYGMRYPRASAACTLFVSSLALIKEARQMDRPQMRTPHPEGMRRSTVGLTWCGAGLVIRRSEGSIPSRSTDAQHISLCDNRNVIFVSMIGSYFIRRSHLSNRLISLGKAVAF